MAIKKKSLLVKYPKAISVFSGIVAAIIIALFLGIPTDVIPNEKYMRMIPASGLDVFFLVAISVLFGFYIALLVYRGLQKKTSFFPANKSLGAIIAGFFAVACPICVQFLVWIFGTLFLLKYYDPLRPFLGIASIALLLIAIFSLRRNTRTTKHLNS